MFLGSLYIVIVKVIIWVNSRLVHCWAGGRHFFHLKELALLVVIKFWGVGGVFVLLVFFSLYNIMIIISVQDNNLIDSSYFFHTSF